MSAINIYHNMSNTNTDIDTWAGTMTLTALTDPDGWLMLIHDTGTTQVLTVRAGSNSTFTVSAANIDVDMST